ncbi:D-glycero-beta-D-manno-heptose 1-phosphate adenylyltransferase [Vicingaceae bacterium]|nr:D-glycero-beta-D-manno-heptose 1-phosphate adenylyltransferase [Vicingaceae bacterium]
MQKFEAVKQKVSSIEKLLEKVGSWKSENQKVVFTNGVFDIIHRGHIEYLAQAADCGDKFIVAVNADASVKRLGKGDSRPLQDETSRAIIMAALHFVDAVVVFNDDTPLNLISEITPDVLIKGGDYDANCTDSSDKKYIVGSDVVKNNGGKVEVIQFVEGYSTTKIEEKIRKA